MSNFEFPSNIRQIGSIQHNLRIYMEDYVFTYIQSYCQASETDEKLAVLVGRYMTIDEQPVLFINGCIQGKYCEEESGIMTFTDESFEYIYDQKDKYFPKADIVGWVQSQPSYGTYLNPLYKKYHFLNFNKPYEVMFVTDPVQKLSCFYAYNEDLTQLEEIKGYFVYYEKNKSMHEYMLENKPVPAQIVKKEAKFKAEFDEEAEEEQEEASEPEVISPKRILASRQRQSEAQIKTRQSVRKRRVRHDQKRMLNMLSGLCAVMFLICTVLGANLIQSGNRITLLEQNLSALNTAYRNMVASNEEAQSAFAEQNKEIKEGAVLTENGNELLKNETKEPIESKPEQNTSEPAKSTNEEQKPAETAPDKEQDKPADQSANTNIPATYTVQQGDNLLFISEKFYGTKNMVDKIMEANGMSDPDKIYFGKVLVLPRLN